MFCDAPTTWWLSAASKVPSRWAPRVWSVIALTRALAKYAADNSSDSTIYGQMKGSHSSFFAHHMSTLAEPVVNRDVITLHQLTAGMASRVPTTISIRRLA